MKKLMEKSMLMSVLVICFVLFFSEQEVHASSLNNIPLQVVDDIQNTPYPKMTNQNYYYYNQINRTEFTIDSPGEVRAIFRVDVRSDSSGSAWIATDSTGNNIVGKTGHFTGAETGISWFLEKGTYYMFSTFGEKPSEENFYQVSNSTISTALLFEKSRTQEVKTSTSFRNNNAMELGKVFRGFLSNTSPSDYYSFRLTRKASITIDYSFDTSNSGDDEIGFCTLYDENELFLTDGSYLSSDRGQQSLTYQLDPGTYFIRLNGILGNTTLRLTPMYYDINITASGEKGWTTEARDIHIETSIDYSEIIVLHRDVKESLLNNNNLWSSENKAFVPIDGETFTAEDSGIYSVRITDVFGNNTIEKIEVSNIDVTNPEIVGVEDNVSYDKPITITWTDDQSGIDANKTTLNGKKVKSGIRVKDEGKYVLNVYDKVGNSSTIEFNIDSTAPTTNVKNGTTYRDIVILRIRDEVSGLKKVMVNNVEELAVYSTLYFHLDGDYTVELWDNADNYRKVEFRINKR